MKGSMVAYGTGRGDKRFIVVDDKEGPELDGIGLDSLRFSPHSHRLAYSAGKDPKQRVVLDGQAGPAYDTILNGTPIFSPDSKTLLTPPTAIGSFQMVRHAGWRLPVGVG